jgi:hypothetical protein
MALIRRTKGTPVLTLCCAPDWMKGGAIGRTDWSKLEVAPTPSHFADYAALARQAALRYPDVTHFLVWNELKGFWDATRNRWRYEDYTNLYNAVYDAVKAVRPDAQIGGPYVVMTAAASPGTSSNPSQLRGSWGVIDQRSLDVITYWLAHKHGASFVAVDGSPAVSGSLTLTAAEGQAKLAAIDGWLRAHTSLPIWWAELYVVPYGKPTPDASTAAAWSNAVFALDASGAAVALFWQPETSPSWNGLWTPTATAHGGMPTASYGALRLYMR